MGAESVRGYRGGYLPRERREIERKLRDGEIRAVVATNALELGIDIGSLDAVVMAGYPGTIASTWQRAGTSGPPATASVAVLVASSAPLDQYIVEHPDYFFDRSPEHAYINPDNLEIALNHLRCAAFELPIREGEKFGPHDTGRTVPVSGGERLSAPVRRRLALDVGHLPGRCRQPARGHQRQFRGGRYHGRAQGDRRGVFSDRADDAARKGDLPPRSAAISGGDASITTAERRTCGAWTAIISPTRSTTRR